MVWEKVDNSLEKEFVFSSFEDIIDFLNILSPFVKETNHHPNFCVYSYKKIKFILTTHNMENKVTELDEKLSKKIERYC